MSANINLPTYSRRGGLQWKKHPSGTWYVSNYTPAILLNNNNLMNEISLQPFTTKNIAYQVKRGHLYTYYFPNTLKSLIKTHNKRRNTRNLNKFLNYNVNNNTVLYRDPQTRRNITRNNIKKVKLYLPRNTRGRAARVIQRVFHSRKRN